MNQHQTSKSSPTKIGSDNTTATSTRTANNKTPIKLPHGIIITPRQSVKKVAELEEINSSRPTPKSRQSTGSISSRHCATEVLTFSGRGSTVRSILEKDPSSARVKPRPENVPEVKLSLAVQSHERLVSLAKKQGLSLRGLALEKPWADQVLKTSSRSGEDRIEGRSPQLDPKLHLRSNRMLINTSPRHSWTSPDVRKIPLSQLRTKMKTVDDVICIQRDAQSPGPLTQENIHLGYAKSDKTAEREGSPKAPLSRSESLLALEKAIARENSAVSIVAGDFNTGRLQHEKNASDSLRRVVDPYKQA